MATSNSTLPRRTCNTCRKEYPLTPEYWHRDNKAKYQLSYRCKACSIIKADAWAKKNPTRRREIQKQWETKNAEKERNRKRALREANADLYRERDRVYALEHKEEKREYDRNRYLLTRDEKREYAINHYRLNYERDFEKRRFYLRRWRQEHPDMARAQNARRRARKLAAEGTYTESDILLQWKAQAGNCWWCGKPLEKYHVDHRIPLDRGGSNNPRNLVLAHPRCNLSKGAKLPSEWIGRLL